MTTVTKTIVTDTGSYGKNRKDTHKMEVEFVLDWVRGAYHQPEDLANWIAQNPYVKSVTFEPKE